MTIATKPEVQIELGLLMTALRELGPEDVLTYDEMRTMLGYDVKHLKPWMVMRAKTKIEKDSGIRFENVRGIGLRRLPASAIPGIGQFARQRIGRIAKTNHARLTDLRGYNDIDSRLQSRIDAERSLLGAVSEVTGTNVQHVASMTKTGPIVAARIFDYIRPDRNTEEENVS